MMMVEDWNSYDLLIADNDPDAEYPLAAAVRLAANFRGRSTVERSILWPKGSVKSWGKILASDHDDDEYKDTSVVFAGGASDYSEIYSDFGVTRAVYFAAMFALLVDPGLRVGVGSKDAGYVADVILEDMRSKKTPLKNIEDIYRSVHVDAKFDLSNRIVISLFDRAAWSEAYVRQETTKAGVHLFEFSDEIFAMLQSSSTEDVEQTIEGLRDANLLHLPYEDIAIRARVGVGTYMTFHVRGPLEIKAVNSDDFYASAGGVIGTIIPPIFFERPHKPLSMITETGTPLDNLATMCLTIFMIAMATRNTVKRDRLANQKPRVVRGLKAGHRGTTYLTRTIIELPPKESIPSMAGKSPKLHLRRGHAHTVRFGKLWAERRVDWFPPILVNCDDGDDPSPKMYKLT